MKIAQFESIGCPGSYIYCDEGMEKYIDNAVRVSEYVEVTFSLRAATELVPLQVAIIDKKIAEISADFGRRLLALKDAKDKLLAIADQRVSA